MGIGPVATWKSTAAAPTPARSGPYWVPRLVTMLSPFSPWQDAQPTRKSLRPASIVDWSAWSVCAEAGARRAKAPPVSSSPRSTTTRPAAGLRRLAESRAVRSRTGSVLRCPGSSGGGRVLLDQVDGREQADPDHVHEVPVVGDDDRAHRLLVGGPSGDEGAAEHEQECHQPAGHVQAVDPRRQVEDRAVGRGGDRHALVYQGD